MHPARLLLLLAALLLAAPHARAADRCHTHCRDKAYVCKDRCKERYGGPSGERHACLRACEIHEHECKVRCR